MDEIFTIIKPRIPFHIGTILDFINAAFLLELSPRKAIVSNGNSAEACVPYKKDRLHSYLIKGEYSQTYLKGHLQKKDTFKERTPTLWTIFYLSYAF